MHKEIWLILFNKLLREIIQKSDLIIGPHCLHSTHLKIHNRTLETAQHKFSQLVGPFVKFAPREDNLLYGTMSVDFILPTKHACTHTYIHTYIHTYRHTYIIYTYIYICTYVRHICTIFNCAYTHAWTYIHVWPYKHT